MNRLIRPSLFLVATLLLAGVFSSNQTVLAQANCSLCISEFRTRGTAGGNDEFIEFYNNTDAAMTITDATPDSNSATPNGYALVASNAAGSTISVRFVIPEGTVIPARGHFLAVNTGTSGYSLGTYATGDSVQQPTSTTLVAGYNSGITDNTGIALYNTANIMTNPFAPPAAPAVRLDAVGFTGLTNANNNAAFFREGSGISGGSGSTNAEYSFVRRLVSGMPVDSGDNQADFVFVATTATSGTLINGRQPILGAPGPENLSSPIVRNATIKSRLLEPTLASTASPNRVRTGTGNSGTVSFRRTLRNNTGQTINSFRFRVNDLSTVGNDGGDTTRAIFALTDSIEFTYDPDDNPTTANTVALSTTLQAPATTNPGGGINASLRVNLPSGVTVASGSSFSVNITFNIIRAGNYRFSLNHEAVLEPATPTPTPSASVHLTMGNPSNATPDVNQPTNYLLVKEGYALAYHRDRGTPVWTSWHLDPSWLGSAPRQNDFRNDPSLPSGWYQVQGTDYSGSGFDRGHMTPSADRTSTVALNSETFFMTNILPQAPQNNQVTWNNLEQDLRALVGQGNELYIISGGVGAGGSGDNGFATTIAGGRVTVPAQTWKVAIVLPQGTNDVSRVTTSTRVIAVIMPNSNNINSDWRTYRVSVDQVEQLTGFDFFSNVEDSVENAIEAGVDSGLAAPPAPASERKAAITRKGSLRRGQ